MVRSQVEWMLDHLVQRLEDGSLPMDRIDRSVERYTLYCDYTFYYSYIRALLERPHLVLLSR
jgi:hypothetical protein